MTSRTRTFPIQSQIMSVHGPPMFHNQSPRSPARLYNHLTSPPFSPVRRKPLPFGSSSVYSSGVTQSPNQSPRLQQPLNKQNPTSSTGRHTQGLLEISPPLDQDGFVIRDLDRYGKNQAPWHVPKTYSSDVHFLLQIPSRRLPEHWAGLLGYQLPW